MNKYHAQKVTYFGKTFDSVKEGQRYLLLRDMEKKGKIQKLKTQVVYPLVPGHPEVKLRPLSYKADFVYEQDGKTVVEDVKGYRQGGAWDLFNAKKKMLYDKYGILVKEV